MSTDGPFRLARRAFLEGAGIFSGGSLLLERNSFAEVPGDTQGLPQRQLGKTKQQVSALALGTWPCGRSKDVDLAGVTAIVNEALDLGINFIDTARNYGKAEEGIGKALGKRRAEVFLATKVWADDADQARRSLEQSMRALRTDYVDLLYLHSVGNRDVEQAMDDDGALTYLLQQKEAGKTRFVGISGHSQVDDFVPLIETGQIDVVMMAMNFVDRYIYGFEHKVLPVANRHDLGVACMKVFGGIRGGFGAADGSNPGPQMQPQYLQQAIRYALGLPKVATLVIGPHTVQQLRENVQLVRQYKPLTANERTELAELGKKLARQWGAHYGPVA